MLGSLSLSGGRTDNSYYDRYRQSQLSKLNYEELKKGVRDAGLFSELEIEELYRRFTVRELPEIRNNLSDGFKTFVDNNIEHMITLYGPEASVIASSRNIADFVRKHLTTITLDCLCRQRDVADLRIVRETIDHHGVDFSEEVLRFLGRFGDWSDRERILSFGGKFDEGVSLLAAIGSRNNYKQVAAALYAIGKSRLLDLLELNIDESIRRFLVAQLS